MIQLNLLGGSFSVRPLPEPGQRMLVFEDPCGIAVTIPLDADHCEKLAQALRGSSLVVPNTAVPMPGQPTRPQ